MTKTNPWVEYVRQYALKNNISYGCAISEAVESYRKLKTVKKPSKKSVKKEEPKKEEPKKSVKKLVKKPDKKKSSKKLVNGTLEIDVPIKAIITTIKKPELGMKRLELGMKRFEVKNWDDIYGLDPKDPNYKLNYALLKEQIETVKNLENKDKLFKNIIEWMRLYC